MMMKHTSPGLRCCCAAILLLSLAVAPAAAAVQWDGVAITTGDYEGLLAIKQALLDPSGYLGGWNDSGLNACSGAWEGIKCARGQVIAIQLPWHGLGGTISEKLGQLTALRKLNLHDNAIQGQVPAAIGLLRNLRGVYLFNNHFSGSVPSSIGDCLLLQTLDLSNNVITGSIPASISNLTGLFRFNLSHNKLVGSIPTGLARLPTLSFLSLEHNNLSGAIPDAWGGAGVTHRLKILSLDGNSLSGPIPASLSSLPMLQELNLGWNLINGSIPEELGKLPMLQRMDLSSNSIGGVLPESLCNMSSLVHLDLEGNQLEGEIPNSVDGLKSLGFLSLRRNRLRGPLPWRLGYVANLSELDLSENNFGGEIPASYARLVHLGSFNVSSNNLSGAVPLLLAERFDSSAFSGNVQLCGYSAAVPCHASSPPPSSSSAAPAGLGNGGASGSGRTRKLTVGNVVILIVVACAALLVVLCCVLLVYWFIRKRAAALSGRSGGAAAGVKQGEGGGGEPESGGDAGGKLVHFDGPILFTADDLLCATAEIMGKTTYGTVYKATLEDGSQVAVKRLREKITKGQKEFEAEAAVLGRIRHSNLLPLRAYYLGPKGEKLLVFDYMPNGSLAAFLHARGPETTIDWPRRARIAAGIARGLLHLHTHESIVHGGLTSANIFLDDGYAPRISEYGLSRLTTASAAATPGALATAGSLGYRAPELAAKQKKASAKTDVYSLGVLLLELLTGKSPGEPVNGLELPQWVVSVVEEDWPSEVFDLELTREGAAGEEELVAALKLALHCVDPVPASRPEVEQVLRQLEEMRPELREGGEDGGRPDAGGSAAA